MSTWDITSKRDKWQGVYYRRGCAPESFGETPKAEYTLDDVARWLAGEQAQTGDLITYGGVVLFQKLKPESE